jgi:hypothetical protein
MQRLFAIAISLFCLFGCNTRSTKEGSKQAINLLIADTTGNRKAQWDHKSVAHCSGIARQLSLGDLRQGADSFEIRSWYDFSMDYGENLSVVKWKDTAVTISFYRIYTKPYDYSNRIEWDPHTQPIVDSVDSRMIRISKAELAGLQFDSLWNILSESEIEVLKNVGYVDGSTEIIEFADNKRYKFLRYHCARSILEKRNVSDIHAFLEYISIVNTLTKKYGVRLHHFTL